MEVDAIKDAFKLCQVPQLYKNNFFKKSTLQSLHLFCNLRSPLTSSTVSLCTLKFMIP